MWWVSKVLLIFTILIGFQNVILAWSIRNILAKHYKVGYFNSGKLIDIIFLLRKHKKEKILLKKEKQILDYSLISYLLFILIFILFFWSMY